jgi:hypothetical protein
MVTFIEPIKGQLISKCLFGIFNSPKRIKEHHFTKVKTIQEACAKCFAVQILKFEILQITWKKWYKEYQILSFHFSLINIAFWCFFFLCFHVVCKISNFNVWTAKHLVQACTIVSTLSRIGRFEKPITLSKKKATLCKKLPKNSWNP